jgi:hypothetical protein
MDKPIFLKVTVTPSTVQGKTSPQVGKIHILATPDMIAFLKPFTGNIYTVIFKDCYLKNWGFSFINPQITLTNDDIQILGK